MRVAGADARASHRGRRRRAALTLVEVLISLIVLQLVVVPLFLVFSGSRQMVVTARELGVAVALASSYLAGVRQVAARDLVDLPPTAEVELPGPLAPATLRVATAPAGVERRVAVRRLDGGGGEGGPYARVEVEVRWRSPVTQRDHRYLAVALLRGRP